MSKLRVAVVRGGISDEYAVSLRTGSTVIAALDRTRFEPLDITITKRGEWLFHGREVYPERILPLVDVVFNALHGTYGEDGTFQRLLDRFGVPYTGTKALASGIAMHKGLTKDFLKDTEIKTAPHVLVKRQPRDEVFRIAERITDTFGPQYVIKPVASGSSVGTMMVKNPLLLPQAIADALEVYDEVMVEKRIIGREATCGVIERFRGEELYALPPIEIVPPPHAEFFDATVKYDGTTAELCPSRFSLTTNRMLESLARTVHTTLNLSQYSRSDFMLADDGIYFLEVNTLPGLTTESLLPKALAAVGSSYASFIEHLLTDAILMARK